MQNVETTTFFNMSNMNRIFVLLVSALLLLCVSCKDKGRIVEPKAGPAHLMVEDSEFNFGYVNDADGILQKDFLIVNDGSEPLVISNVHAHCHCTEVDYPKKPIRPGHGARVTVRLDVRSLSTGYFSRTIDFYPNGGGSPTRVEVKGEKL